MKSLFKPLLIAALLATAGLSAYAQDAGGPPPGVAGMHHRGPMDPAKMQEMMVKRAAALKAKLNLGATQEGPWATYMAAMQPPADMDARMNPENRKKMHDEWAALTTPQRIDKMHEMKVKRDAEMATRGDATKAFYAALSPAQQKVFDTSTMRHGHGGPHGGRDGTGKPANG
jgi:protein CpxP